MIRPKLGGPHCSLGINGAPGASTILTDVKNMEYETDIFLAGRPASNPADYGKCFCYSMTFFLRTLVQKFIYQTAQAFRDFQAF